MKTGNGLLTLSSGNTYTGATTVNGGTLQTYDSATSSFTAANGGTLLFFGDTMNLNTRSIHSTAGGLVVYQSATINGGFLYGPGTHSLPAGFASTLNATTINPTSVMQEGGADTFYNVTNRGMLFNNGYLTVSGGINDGGGILTVNGTCGVSDWINAGVISITSGGILNNHLSDMTSYGGGRITVNSGGTLNADSQSEGVAMDLQDSLLVNNGTVAGTTNVYYGATVSGSGAFGPINVFQGGTLAISPSAAPIAPSLAVSSGSVTGGGALPAPTTVTDARFDTPDATDTMTLSGNLSGPGPITKGGAGLLILSGTNTYGGGTIVSDGTLKVFSSSALPDGTSLTVGAAALFAAPVVALPAAPIAPVPEPSTLALMAFGLWSAAACRRFSKRRQAA